MFVATSTDGIGEGQMLMRDECEGEVRLGITSLMTAYIAVIMNQYILILLRNGQALGMLDLSSRNRFVPRLAISRAVGSKLPRISIRNVVSRCRHLECWMRRCH